MLPKERKPTAAEIEAEIASLTATANYMPVHRGVKMMKRVAALKMQLHSLQNPPVKATHK